MNAAATPSLPQDPLRRFLRQDPSLTPREIAVLIDEYCPGQDDVHDAVLAALADPPSFIIAAANLVGDLCRALRAKLAPLAALTPDESEMFNLARERMALCAAMEDSLPHADRLARVITCIEPTTPHDDLLRPLSVRIVAEASHVLASDYGQAGSQAVGAQAFTWIQDRAVNESEAIDALGKGWELRLRQCLADPAALAPLRTQASTRIRQHVVLDGARSWRAVTHCTLLSIVGRDRGFPAWGTRLLRSFGSAGQDDRTAQLERIVRFAARLLRVRAAAGCPASAGELRTLARLIQKLRFAQAGIDETIRDWKARTEPTAPAVPFAGTQASTIDSAEAEARRLLSPQGAQRWGLALSGGGLRATLFHLGVLAWLAESGQLGRIEALSCVSGGSIAGAAYALRLKTLLEEKHDGDIARDDHVEVVRDVIAAVGHLASRNLRTRALASPAAILRLWFVPGYTLSDRLAEVLDLELFSRLRPWTRELPMGELRRTVRDDACMTRPLSPGNALRSQRTIEWPPAPWDLDYAPQGTQQGTRRQRNELRSAKIPDLSLNTTALNSGNALRFGSAAYGENPDRHQGVLHARPGNGLLNYGKFVTELIVTPSLLKLSRAVCASAAVPGLFPPIVLPASPHHVEFALADGGVHDNQGIDHLIDQRCTHVIVSDAAAQLPYETNPDLNNFAVFGRTTNVLMERIREMTHERLVGAAQRGEVEAHTQLHLTAELSTPRLPRKPARQPASPSPLASTYEALLYWRFRRSLTTYGVRGDAQELVARIRTDLDCFSEIEVQALMLDGYQLARHDPMIGADAAAATELPAVDWPFQPFAAALGPGFDEQGDVAIVLRAASRRLFRLPQVAWAMAGRTRGRRIARGIATGAAALAAIAVVGLAWHPLVSTAARLALGPALPIGLLCLAAVALLVFKVPASATKRRVVQWLLGPLFVAGMFWSWGVLALADPLYRQLCRYRPGPRSEDPRREPGNPGDDAAPIPASTA